jgi:hypothetical protein
MKEHGESAAVFSMLNIDSADPARLARFYAANAIPPGTLLNGAMVIRASGVTVGRAVLGLALKDGQLPGNLQVSDHINIYDVATASGNCPGTPGKPLALNAVVLAITVPSATSGSVAVDNVVVALAPADAGPVTCNASNGSVGVAILPGGGR